MAPPEVKGKGFRFKNGEMAGMALYKIDGKDYLVLSGKAVHLADISDLASKTKCTKSAGCQVASTCTCNGLKPVAWWNRDSNRTAFPHGSEGPVLTYAKGYDTLAITVRKKDFDYPKLKMYPTTSAIEQGSISFVKLATG